METFRFEHANATLITDFLAVGGDLHESTARAVVEAVEIADTALVTHVLDVRLEAEETLWDRIPEVEYRWDGIDDAGQRVPSAWFERNTAWADSAIEAGGTVLTHCHMGINRGPSAGYAILLRRGWDPVEAIDLIRAARPQAHVAYAEDALEWHLARTAEVSVERRRARAALAEWRRTHPMDVQRAIRGGGRVTPGQAA
jgi:dual specificity phosphatase 3